MFFSIHCVIGGVKTRRVPLFGGAPPGFVAPLRSSGAEGPPASHSVQEERAHTEKCATLRVRVVRGREGGGVDGFVEWGRRGWMVLEEEEGKERKTHTTSEKKQMHNEKEETSAAAAAQNKTFDSLFKLVSWLVSVS